VATVANNLGKTRLRWSVIILCLLAAVWILAACAAASSESQVELAPQEILRTAPAKATAAEGILTTSTPAPQATLADAAPEATSPAPAINERRLLILEWPPAIRLGDADIVRLGLEVDQEGRLTPTVLIEGHEVTGETVFIPNLFDTHNVLVEARLDMAGVEIVPGGELSEPLRPGREVSFVWSVRPTALGVYRGTVWAHLLFIPLADDQDGELTASRRPLTAQIIEIKAINFLGLGGAAARILGGVGTIVGSALGLDPLFSFLWKRLRKQALRKAGR